MRCPSTTQNCLSQANRLFLFRDIPFFFIWFQPFLKKSVIFYPTDLGWNHIFFFLVLYILYILLLGLLVSPTPAYGISLFQKCRFPNLYFIWAYRSKSIMVLFLWAIPWTMILFHSAVCSPICVCDRALRALLWSLRFFGNIILLWFFRFPHAMLHRLLFCDSLA